AVVWMMINGGEATNSAVSELSGMLRKESIVIDASNSIYTDSMENYSKMKSKGIYYLDVGCAGGPEDLTRGVALMVGGDESAFRKVEGILRAVSGNGTYGYVGGSGCGHKTKLVHNGIFYGIMPVYSEGIGLLMKLDESGPQSNMDMGEALRLLAASPPITTDIMDAIARVHREGSIPNDAPAAKISDMVKWESEKAAELGADLGITNAILRGYPSMSGKSRIIYYSAKRIITGH
ncbi:MAG: NAD(P)-binding domain-containing protein, partial [Candidatus Micrarchaeaceae archaeon]